MQNTVIGVYDSYSQAKAAFNELVANGYTLASIKLSPDQDDPAARGQALQAQEEDEHGFSLGKFFHSLFGGEEEGRHHHDVYREAMRRGSYLVTVQTESDSTRDQACQIMDRFDPVDIDQRSSHWRSQGWSGYDRAAAPYTDEEMQRERSLYPASDPIAASLDKRVRVYGVDPALANTANTMGATGATPGTGLADDDSAAFRSHWQSAYANQGGRYEDFEPAYRFGSSQRQQAVYHGRQWDDIEPELRNQWEGQYADTPWERAKAAVRHAWEKIPG